MKRINQVAQKNGFVPEFGYAVFHRDGMTIWNGLIGLHYKPTKVGAKLMDVVAKAGVWAAPVAQDLFAALGHLDHIVDIDPDKDRSILKVTYSGGKATLELPVLFDISPDMPHLRLKWEEYESDRAGSIPVDSTWQEAHGMITNEANLVWSDSVGVYYLDGYVCAFDKGVFIKGSEKTQVPDSFIPKNMLDLGLSGIDYAVVRKGNDGEKVFLVGREVQYVSTASADFTALRKTSEAIDEFEKGTRHLCSIESSKMSTKRIKAFSENGQVGLSVENCNIYLSGPNWKEKFGSTDAPDMRMVAKMSCILRWIDNCTRHELAKSEDGAWYLQGLTRQGLKFYAVAGWVKKAVKAPEVSENDLKDIEAGSDLFA